MPVKEKRGSAYKRSKCFRRWTRMREQFYTPCYHEYAITIEVEVVPAEIVKASEYKFAAIVSNLEPSGLELAFCLSDRGFDIKVQNEYCYTLNEYCDVVNNKFGDGYCRKVRAVAEWLGTRF